MAPRLCFFRVVYHEPLRQRQPTSMSNLDVTVPRFLVQER